MRAPEFWASDAGALSRLAALLLSPLGAASDAAGRARRGLIRPWRAPVPVICVGNLTVGGSGKTPVTRAVALRLAALGKRVHVLSHGYGSSAQGPTRVEPEGHGADQVGDEALLLAADTPTWVARDRRLAARAAVEAGAELLVMDDGFQNPALVKDLSLVVVDGAYGFGNGRVIPAGPLREPVGVGLERADAIVRIGPDRTRLSRRLDPELPLLEAELAPEGEWEGLRGHPVAAFAGIGRPRKFFETLEGIGCHLLARHSFPDHHFYRAGEIERMAEHAKRAGARLVTTEKDAVRLNPEDMQRVTVLKVRIAWNNPAALDALLRPVLEHPLSARDVRENA